MLLRRHLRHSLTFLLLSMLCTSVGLQSLSAQTDTTLYYLTRTCDAQNITKDGATLRGEILVCDTSIHEVGFLYSVNEEQQIITGIKDPTSAYFYATISGLPVNTEVKFISYSRSCVSGTALGTETKYFTTGENAAPTANTTPATTTTVANIKIGTHVVRHRTSFGYTLAGWLNINNLTGEKRRLINACDYRSDVVRSKALEVARKSPGSFNLGQICDIFDFCYYNWSYVNDPSSRDIYQKASFTIKNQLSGDCDDFAILVCSMLLSIGGDARINFAYQKNHTAGHAFTEINLGKVDTQKVADYISNRYKNVWTGNIHYRIDRQKNCWLNMDWWAKHPGGKYYQANCGTRFYILDNYCEDY